MTDRTQRLAIIVTAQDLAAGKLKNVRSELAQLGTSGRLAAVGLGGVMVVANKSGQALGHLRNRLTQLAGPLGFIGVTAGVVGLVGALKSGIDKAGEFGRATEDLAKLTGLGVQKTSALVDVLDKYGIVGDAQIKTIGMLEKNLGNLAGTTTKGGASTEALTKASEALRLAQVKLHEVETKRGTTASARLAAHQRVADAERRLAELRKTGGVTTGGAIAFEKKYGLSILDSSGKVADANTILQRSADYFNSNAESSQKAAAMAKLFGRSWQTLIPVLSLGSKGIKQETADAIHLTDAQLAQMAKFRVAQRDWADSLGDLQTLIGVDLVPDLTAGLKEGTAWLSTHQDDVRAWFRDAVSAAKGFASFVTGTVVPTISGLAGAAGSFWNSIPGPLRDLLVKGFVADRTIKFLFGMSPIHLVASLAEGAISRGLGGAAGGFFARGSSPANPLFVSGTGIGGVGPVGPGGGLGLASKVFLVGEAIGLAVLVNDVRQNLTDRSTQQSLGVQDNLNKFLAQSPGKADLEKALGGVEKGITDLQTSNLPFFLVQGDALDNLKKMRVELKQQLAEQRGDRLTGNLGRSGPMGIAATALDKTASTMTLLQQQLHADFRDAIGALRKATDPAAILEAAKRVTTDILGGVGSGKTTKATIADLTAKRDLLLAAGDKTNAAILTAEIRKISPLVAGRAHQAAQIAEAKKIAASNESVKQKVADLKGIESTLLSEHRTTAAGIIHGLIDVVNAVKGISIPSFPVAGGLVGNVHNMPGGPRPAPAGLVGNVHNMPTRQHGGPVWRDHDYIVGEKGPERFRPKRDGVIIPDIPLVGNFGRGPMPHRASGGSFWPSKSAYTGAAQRHSYPAVDREFGNIVAAIRGLLIPHITLAVTASDMQKARVTRSRIVKPLGSRGSRVGEFG